MGNPPSFRLRHFNSPAGEPHVYVFEGGETFPTGLNVAGARVLDISYGGGGWLGLFHDIAQTAEEPCLGASNLQAMYENLECLAGEQPLVLVIRNADGLLADVGASLLGAMAHWEAFVRHGGGLSPMYLVLDAHPAQID